MTRTTAFRTVGFTTITNAMAKWQAADMGVEAMRIHKEIGIRKEGEASRGGHSQYYVLDGPTVEAHFPELTAWYKTIRPVIEGLANEEVICSPYPRSAVNVKVYDGATSGQGWHYDTNPISALLYLTGSGSPTELVALDGTCYSVHPTPGKLLVFKGREILHHVPPGNAWRVTAPMNYYHPWDVDRPEWIDSAIYENAAPPPL